MYNALFFSSYSSSESSSLPCTVFKSISFLLSIPSSKSRNPFSIAFSLHYARILLYQGNFLTEISYCYSLSSAILLSSNSFKRMDSSKLKRMNCPTTSSVMKKIEDFMGPAAL